MGPIPLYSGTRVCNRSRSRGWDWGTQSTGSAEWGGRIEEFTEVEESHDKVRGG
jgi:hypothetical protein